MIFAAEMGLWWVRATFRKTPEWISRQMRRWPFELLISQLSKHAQRIISLDPKSLDPKIKSRNWLRKLQRNWATLGFTDCLAVLLRFCEFTNAVFLTYIVFAQTLGAYQVGFGYRNQLSPLMLTKDRTANACAAPGVR